MFVFQNGNGFFAKQTGEETAARKRCRNGWRTDTQSIRTQSSIGMQLAGKGLYASLAD